MCLVVAVSLMPGLPGSAWAQQPESSSTEPAPASPVIIRPAAQDIVALSTTASLERFQSYFRLTHRFTRDLRGPVGEFIPRPGFTPGAHQWAAGIETRTDGHQFQLNVSNSFGTTHAQIARGGQPGNVRLGFNLGRIF